jgi:peptidylprolyl isomerase
MKKKYLWVVLAAIVVVTLGVIFVLKNNGNQEQAGSATTENQAPVAAVTPGTGQTDAKPADPSAGGDNTMIIETTYGNVEIELFPGDAPKTVARMKELAKQGFFNGLAFHSVVPGFVVQGGDPRGDGTGGSGQNLPAEFNSRQHVEGTVAMARAADINSADSQFYISLGRHPHLDGQYTVFGQVKSGMDAVKKIKQGDKMLKVTVP